MSELNVFAFDATECPHCHHSVDTGACSQGDANPKPGDKSICAYCGEISVFADNLQLRKPTEEEANEELAPSDQFIREIIRRRTKSLWKPMSPSEKAH